MTYTLIQQINNELAHLKFKGPFQGRTVTWDTHFFTLDAYIAENKITDTSPKQVIDIQPIETDIMKLTVVLNISEINKSSIQKMMIMIKQYKNLSIGRYEYG